MAGDITLALNYRCNNDCGFCFLKKERALGLADTERAGIYKIFAKNARTRRYSRLIISGAEATLRRDLPELVSRALKRGGFSAVRLQTNGRKLADPGYCRELVSCGISEFLVSIHAPTPALYARITGSRSGFRQMQKGLRNILANGAELVSSTVVTSYNYSRLRELASFLAAEGVPDCQFWSFLELGAAGQSKYHVRLAKALPRLFDALDVLKERGIRVSLSWFPRCLLGSCACLLENYYSPTVICKEFKRRMEHLKAFHCFYSGSCVNFRKSCLGIHDRYREVFGDERMSLIPVKKRTPRLRGQMRTCDS